MTVHDTLPFAEPCDILVNEVESTKNQIENITPLETNVTDSNGGSDMNAKKLNSKLNSKVKKMNIRSSSDKILTCNKRSFKNIEKTNIDFSCLEFVESLKSNKYSSLN